MYQKIIKPLLFKLPIDRAHALAITLLQLVGAMPYGYRALRASYRVDHPSLKREVFGTKFHNPVGLAAGFDSNGEIINEISALGFGFVEVGTITPQAQEGNPKPRVFRLSKDRAIVNRTGNANRGWQYAIENLRKKHTDIVVGCNIGVGSNTNPKLAGQDYLKSFRTLYQYADYFTVNLTSDNAALDTKSYTFETLSATLAPLFEFRRGQSEYRPIMVKISPDVDDTTIDMVIDVLVATPLDGIVAVAGTRNREGLKTSQSALSKISAGRLSGEPLRTRALEVVRYIHQKCAGAYPIIGVGGMSTPAHVREMLEAGASLVQIYSGFIYEGPSIAKHICQDLICTQTSDNEN